MSAYGPIGSASRTATLLPTTRWRLNPTSKFTPAPNSYLTIHHVTLATASAIPGLVGYLRKTFADELERGLTYPQEILPGETYTLEAFQAYYFAADVLVAVVGGSADREVVDGEEVELSLSKAIDGKTGGVCRWMLLRETQLSRAFISRMFIMPSEVIFPMLTSP